MSYDDIVSYCQVNKLANDVCQDIVFWLEKLDIELQYEGDGGYIFKPSNYIRLYEHPDQDGPSIYIRWKTHDLGKDFNDRVKNKYNDMVFWMMDRYNKYFTNDIYRTMAQSAAKGNNMEVLLWLEGRGQTFDEYTANYAAGNGHLDLLAWFKQKGFTPNIIGVNMASENGHLNVLEYLEQQLVLPNVNTANAAAGSGHLNILKWLQQRAIMPNRQGVIRANTNGQFHVMEWLEQYSITL